MKISEEYPNKVVVKASGDGVAHVNSENIIASDKGKRQLKDVKDFRGSRKERTSREGYQSQYMNTPLPKPS